MTKDVKRKEHVQSQRQQHETGAPRFFANKLQTSNEAFWSGLIFDRSNKTVALALAIVVAAIEAGNSPECLQKTVAHPHETVASEDCGSSETIKRASRAICALRPMSSSRTKRS